MQRTIQRSITFGKVLMTCSDGSVPAAANVAAVAAKMMRMEGFKVLYEGRL